jgi:NTP pyrophosphatase (non-canonical NTP hydrolase)
MTLFQYQKQSQKFRLPSANRLYAILNLSGEVGELHSLIAKAERDGPKDDFMVNVEKELGDILWHIAAVCDDYGLKLDRVAAINIDKLTDRAARGVTGGSGDNR